MDKIIIVDSLVKNYGDVLAVKGISFRVERGELFAFLGLNGAGKTTTINILCTILKKTDGKVVIDGFDLDKNPEEIKDRIGIVFQGSVLDERLTVKDNLTVRASYYGLRGAEWKKRLDELTELFTLGDILSRPYGKLSGGQRRRADVARGLVNRPALLFLDEPTTGLDPQTRKHVWDVLHGLRRETGMTVFLTTHYMEEADDADTVVIMDNGEIVAQGTPNDLKNRFSGDYVRIYRPRDPSLDTLFAAEGLDFGYEGEAYRIKLASTAEAKRFIGGHDNIVTDFEVIKGDMDDVFLRATGKKLQGGGV